MLKSALVVAHAEFAFLVCRFASLTLKQQTLLFLVKLVAFWSLAKSFSVFKWTWIVDVDNDMILGNPITPIQSSEQNNSKFTAATCQVL